MQPTAHLIELQSSVAPLQSRFWPSESESSDRNCREITLASREAASRATPTPGEVVKRREWCIFLMSPPQAPPTVLRLAAGAAHGVDDARASDLPGNTKQAQLRAHALAGSTAVERVAVERRTVVERSGGWQQAWVMKVR